MESLLNVIFGAGIGVAIVLTFWGLLGFADDVQHRARVGQYPTD